MSASTTTRQLGAAVRMLLLLTVLLGIVYPALVWGIGRIGFAAQADGSRIVRDGQIVGSSLLGQDFPSDRFFQGRPSASEYAGGVSGGSNLSPTSEDQLAAVAEREAAYAQANGGVSAPPDALTASGSGLDPHISPENALAQSPRVGAATGLPEQVVTGLVREHTEQPLLGFLGEPRVLQLNLAVLDRTGG